MKVAFVAILVSFSVAIASPLIPVSPTLAPSTVATITETAASSATATSVESLSPSTVTSSETPSATPTAPSVLLTQAQAQSRLSAAGITTSSSGNCTDRTKPNCTSLEGIRSGTIDGIITLKNASGATINITGGTEVGHAGGTRSHANGYKVDIRHNPTVDAYIKNNFTKIENRGDGYPQWRSPAGNIYCDEGDHWDITYI